MALYSQNSPKIILEENGIIAFPDDSESVDRRNIAEMIENYFDTMYPDFEPEIVSTFEKQYYLPALKVLNYIDGEYYSPGYTSRWENSELTAVCRDSIFPKWYTLSSGFIEEEPHNKPKHSSPNENCHCGIYGSVNLEEIYGYINADNADNAEETPIPKVLCIIEPSEDANIILCRKGWRASHAFISEIVGETISIEEASGLLSMAWNRSIDVRKCYENR